ncbi:3-phosphoshikimate 1-carboxyvinyltransferase [Fusobacterium necrogenes]|uniref:3-phosphoshikimate 1-carboxyvinyltransferase n=1 Tax=Fusobacterium necrogenes TaxID=858 RepID=UPI00255CCC6A|nr:3-phosphoshikimate 1-carboxyvinyltransferase [Fusobacterium necrogenes]
MKVKIYPSKCFGEILIPPSKSIAHRAIICASLADGKSKIENITYSDDILATIAGMKKLGANIVKNKNTLYIEGVKNFSGIKDDIIDCNESGSTLRFLIPIFSLTNKKIEFKGKNRLLHRPLEIYKNIFLRQALFYKQDKKSIKILGRLQPNEYTIPGNISSQFISGLLFALPLLKENSTIKIIPPLESKSYIDLTIDTLKIFGIKINFVNELTISIPGGQKYIPTDYKVEGDFSQLAFFAVLGALNNTITCRGLQINSKQGDKEIIKILKKTGIKIEKLKDGYRFFKGIPKGNIINLENCPDLGPILTVFSSYGNGNFKLYNTQRLRYKESDRIVSMEKELRKFGVEISSDKNNIYIKGKTKYNSCGEVFGHKDHRVIMSLAIFATLLDTPLIINGAEFISKSYPNFFEDLKKINIFLKIYNED